MKVYVDKISQYVKVGYNSENGNVKLVILNLPSEIKINTLGISFVLYGNETIEKVECYYPISLLSKVKFDITALNFFASTVAEIVDLENVIEYNTYKSKSFVKRLEQNTFFNMSVEENSIFSNKKSFVYDEVSSVISNHKNAINFKEKYKLKGIKVNELKKSLIKINKKEKTVTPKLKVLKVKKSTFDCDIKNCDESSNIIDSKFTLDNNVINPRFINISKRQIKNTASGFTLEIVNPQIQDDIFIEENGDTKILKNQVPISLKEKIDIEDIPSNDIEISEEDWINADIVNENEEIVKDNETAIIHGSNFEIQQNNDTEIKLIEAISEIANKKNINNTSEISIIKDVVLPQNQIKFDNNEAKDEEVEEKSSEIKLNTTINYNAFVNKFINKKENNSINEENKVISIAKKEENTNSEDKKTTDNEKQIVNGDSINYLDAASNKNIENENKTSVPVENAKAENAYSITPPIFGFGSSTINTSASAISGSSAKYGESFNSSNVQKDDETNKKSKKAVKTIESVKAKEKENPMDRFKSKKKKSTRKENIKVLELDETKSKEKGKSSIFKIAIPVILGVLTLALLNVFVLFNLKISSDSMSPTLENNDLVFGTNVFEGTALSRGEIVIFEKEIDGKKETYVKRIIGLPGEVVQIKPDGGVYVDGVLLKENYVMHKDSGSFDFKVPKGKYLMLGDNRSNSNDSRYWEDPYIKKSEVLGKVRLLVSPFNRFGFIK